MTKPLKSLALSKLINNVLKGKIEQNCSNLLSIPRYIIRLHLINQLLSTFHQHYTYLFPIFTHSLILPPNCEYSKVASKPVLAEHSVSSGDQGLRPRLQVPRVRNPGADERAVRG